MNGLFQWSVDPIVCRATLYAFILTLSLCEPAPVRLLLRTFHLISALALLSIHCSFVPKQEGKKKKSAGFVSLCFLLQKPLQVVLRMIQGSLKAAFGELCMFAQIHPNNTKPEKGDETPIHSLPGITRDLRLPAFRNVVITSLGIFVEAEDIPSHFLPSQKCPPVPCLVGSSSREH